MPTVYLLHIDPPVGGRAHYIGCTNHTDVMTRYRQHLNGEGAQLTKAALKIGSTITLAGFWTEVDWSFEKKLKGRSAKPLCPVCNPSAIEGRDLSAAGG